MVDESSFISASRLESFDIGLETARSQLRSRIEEIQSLQDKYRDLYDASPVGYLVLDKSCIILDSNLTFSKMLGIDREKLIGTSIASYIAPAARLSFTRKLGKTFATGSCRNFLTRIVRKNGSLLYAGCEAVVVQDNQKSQKLCRLSVADIYRYENIKARLARSREEVNSKIQSRTKDLKEAYRKLSQELLKLKQAEDYLRQSKEFSSSLLENSPNPIVLTNIDTSIQYVNPAFESLTGFSIAEVIGKKSPYPWWPQDLKPQYEQENMPGRTRTPNTLERRYQKKNGETLWIVLSIKPATDITQTRGFLGNWVDITERKRSEEQIEQSRQKIEKLFHLMAEGAILWDTGLRVVQLNTEAERIFGMKQEEIGGQPYRLADWSVKPPWERIRPDGTPMPEEELPAFRANQTGLEVRNVEFGHRWSDGRVTWIIASAVPVFDAEESINGILCTFTDITERKKMRAEREYFLAQTTRIQEEERKRISRELHDDIAQYLSLLTLELDALAAQDKILTAEVINSLRKLHATAEQSMEKVRRFSHELHPGVLEKFGLIAALELLTSEFNEHESIKIKFNPAGPENRLADEAELALFRIVQESLTNIRKHSQATQASVAIEYLSHKVRLVIADNGKGFRLEEKGYDAAKRGSLGLISMQERAALINATLKVNSWPKKGTTVSVELNY